MLLWSNVLADSPQVDLYQYLRKLRPTDSVETTAQLQIKLIPALLRAMIGDCNANFPPNLIEMRILTARQSVEKESAMVKPIHKFAEWAEPLLTYQNQSHSIFVTDDGNLLSWQVSEHDILTSYLRVTPENNDQVTTVQTITNQLPGCKTVPDFLKLMDANTLPTGYLMSAMYRLRPRFPVPEHGPAPRFKSREMPIARLLAGNTPGAIREILNRV